MNIQAAEIEQIVRVVLQRLRANQPAPGSSVPESSSGGPIQNNATLQVPQHVVSLAEIGGKLDSIRCVQVKPRAVVTPAVRDELRQQGIELSRTLEQAEIADAGKPLVVAPKQKAAALASHAAVLEPWQHDGSEASALETISNRLRASARVAVWCTSRPFAAVSCTQAQSNVRAVQIQQPAQLQQALDEAEPNLLIIEDSNWSAAAIVNLVQRWRSGK